MIYTTKLIHLKNNETGYYRFTHLPSHRHRGIAKVHPWYYRLWRSEGCWYLCQGTCAEAWTMLFRCRNQLRYLVKWKFICNFTPQYKTYHLTCGGCTTKVEPPAPFLSLLALQGQTAEWYIRRDLSFWRILVMFAFLMCCICSKADIQYKGILSSNYTTSKPYIFVV